MLLASARGQQARGIAKHLGCDEQTVRHVIQAFNARGLAALRRGFSAPHRTPQAVFDLNRCEPLRSLLHQSPRTFGQPTSDWTLRLVADVAYAGGFLPRPVSGDTIRHALAVLKTRWKRAKQGITSPDPAYLRKKPARPAHPPSGHPPGLGLGVCGCSLGESSGPTRHARLGPP